MREIYKWHYWLQARRHVRAVVCLSEVSGQRRPCLARGRDRSFAYVCQLSCVSTVDLAFLFILICTFSYLLSIWQTVWALSDGHLNARTPKTSNIFKSLNIGKQVHTHAYVCTDPKHYDIYIYIYNIYIYIDIFFYVYGSVQKTRPSLRNKLKTNWALCGRWDKMNIGNGSGAILCRRKALPKWKVIFEFLWHP